jgi:hypothetical protein
MQSGSALHSPSDLNTSIFGSPQKRASRFRSDLCSCGFTFVTTAHSHEGVRSKRGAELARFLGEAQVQYPINQQTPLILCSWLLPFAPRTSRPKVRMCKNSLTIFRGPGEGTVTRGFSSGIALTCSTTGLGFAVLAPILTALTSIFFPVLLGRMLRLEPAGRVAGMHTVFAMSGQSVASLVGGAVSSAGDYSANGYVVTAGKAVAAVFMYRGLSMADRQRFGTPTLHGMGPSSRL